MGNAIDIAINNDDTDTNERISATIENNNPFKEGITPINSTNTTANASYDSSSNDKDMECNTYNNQSEDASTSIVESVEDKGLSNNEANPIKEINEDLEEGECTSDEEEVVPVIPEQIKKQENEEKKKDRKHRHRSRSRSRDRHK